MLKSLFSYGSHKAALVLLLLVSLGLTQVPLFNYLGYEFSVAIALLWSLVSGLLTVSLWNKTASSGQLQPVPFFGRSLLVTLAPLIVPLLVITLNAFAVKNCSYTQGLILFLLIVIPSVFFADVFSFLLIASFRRLKKTSFILGWILILLHVVFITCTRPQIFAFNPILGFFAGLTYDETLSVVDRLILYRIGTLAFSGFLLLEGIAIWRRRTGQQDEQAAGVWNRGAFVSLALLIIAGTIYVLSDRLGLSSSASSIENALGGRTETEHFVISFPDSSVRGLRIHQLAGLHEFYYDRLVRALRVRPSGKIHVYLYASSDQKGRLIGASRTNFAKPWLRQLHINLADVNSTIKHELVHVLAAEFGVPVLRVGVNSGLIEGLAVAMERMEYEEPINRIAGAALAAGPVPDMRSLFSLSGFLKAPAGVSYTLAGSFCRFLIDRYGMRQFKLLYGTGEYDLLYGKPLESLLQDWRRTMTAFRFSDADLEKARYLFSRRSIFGKECARVIANLNRATSSLFGKRRYAEALASADRSLAHSFNADAVYQKSAALLRLGRFPEAVSFTESILLDSLAGPSFLTLKLTFGDALWGVDSLERAMKAYSDLLRSHLSSAWDETLALRIEVLLASGLAMELKPYFLTPTEDSVKLQDLEKLAAAHPAEPVIAYLIAREKMSRDQYGDAAKALDGITRWRSPILEFVRQRRLGQLWFALGKYEKAKIYFWQSLNYVYRDVHAAEIQEQIRLCDWMESFRTGFN